jgi:hypothetical protein
MSTAYAPARGEFRAVPCSKCGATGKVQRGRSFVRLARHLRPGKFCREQARKQFFFEKKNQKTFVRLRTRYVGWSQTNESKSFLVLFLNKNRLLPA